MATICFDWIKTHAPFFRRHGHPRTPHNVSEVFKLPIKSLAILFFKDTEILGVNWKSNPASSRPCTWGIEKLKSRKVLRDFSKIMGATSSTACDQGLIKRVHVCWGPALRFFYCADSVILIYRNSLEGLCHILHNRSI